MQRRQQPQDVHCASRDCLVTYPYKEKFLAATSLSFSSFPWPVAPVPYKMADPYEDLEPYLMEDNFDEKYADELEMLRELDDSDVPPPSHRSCRGRQYSPPPPPNWDEEAFSEAELKEDPPPARSTQPTDATTKGEPVVLCTSEFRSY